MKPTFPFNPEARTDHLFMPTDHMEEVYTSNNPFVKLVHVGRLDAIVRQIPSGGRLKILDAGCGEGHLLEKLYQNKKDYQYYGADITEAALENARKRCPWAQFRKANLSNTGFEEGFFDGVICTEVLEHIYEYQAVLNELKRILKKDGSLIVTFPNECLWTISRFLLGRRPVKVPDHVNSFNPSSMRNAVGLPVTKHVNLPFGLPFALSLNGLTQFKKEGS